MNFDNLNWKWAGIAVVSLLVLYFAFFTDADAATFKGKSPNGFVLEDSALGLLICRSQGGGVVMCDNPKGVRDYYVCEYRDPDQGFIANCKEYHGT